MEDQQICDRLQNKKMKLSTPQEFIFEDLRFGFLA